MIGDYLRTGLLALRLNATQGLRERRLRELSLQRAAPIVVLFYHRVADDRMNAWSITSRDFGRHLDYICDHFEWIDLPEAQRRIREGDSPRPAVHLTFDDGYSDNCRFALPEVIRRKIPCTYFVTLHNILTGEQFAHDRKLGLNIRPNSLEEINQLAAAGIEIGAHTRHHLDLGAVDSPDVMQREITASAIELGERIGRPIRYFAFPYGMPRNMPTRAIETVVESGMQGFCSAFGGYNLPGRDWFHIRRAHADPGITRLKNWLSFDSRKVNHEPTIFYSLPSLGVSAPSPHKAANPL